MSRSKERSKGGFREVRERPRNDVVFVVIWDISTENGCFETRRLSFLSVPTGLLVDCRLQKCMDVKVGRSDHLLMGR